MFEKFTEDAIKSFMFAQDEARRLGYNRVGTENVLLGVIRVGDAASELKNAGVTLEVARAEIERLLGRASDLQEVEMPLTENAKRLITQSWQESTQMGVGYISSDHLLLAIFSLGEGVAFDVLSRLKVDLSALRAAIESRLHTHTDLSAEPQYLNLADASKYTAASNEVLYRAALETSRLGFENIDTEHILVGLLDDSELIAAKALQSFGLAAQSVRTRIETITGVRSTSATRSLGFTSRAKMVLNRALHYTRKLNKDFVTPEHILLALLDESDGAVVGILDAFNVDVNALRIKLTDLMSAS